MNNIDNFNSIDNLNRKEELEIFLQSLGISNADIDLVNLAMTHRSYSFEMSLSEDNERLEFLGDSLLGFVISGNLYDKYPDADEGFLSKRKSRIVSGSMLGQLAENLNIGPLLLLGRGEDMTGGRDRPNLLGCSLEALIGAVYLSTSLEHATDFISSRIFDPAERLLETDIFADYKSRLQEFAQKNFQYIPEYQVVDESGPDHKKHFYVKVFLGGVCCGTGCGARKKVAENEAARVALENADI
jgi:ribonuclease III